MDSCVPTICASRVLSQGFPFYFNSGTTNSDPGAGAIRYNQIIQATTTEIYINFLSANGSSIQDYLNNILNSTNPILGQVYVYKGDNSGKGQVFNVTSVTFYSSYAKIVVALVDEMNGPNPLSFGDCVIFSFTQAGDAGTPGGPQGYQGAQGPQGYQGVAGAAGGSSAPNNPTNPSFVGSGQTPASAGATASNGQTATGTFGTQAILFMVTYVLTGQYILCGTSYAASTISSIDDPGNLFTSNPSGPGIYISKLANSDTISLKNLTGSSSQILVQGINSPITSATAWA